MTRYDEAIEFESEEVKAARHAPTGFTNPAFVTGVDTEGRNGFTNWILLSSVLLIIHIEMMTILDWCKGEKSQPAVDDGSNENIFELGSDPVIEEHVEVSIEKESERIEQGELIYVNFTLNLFCQKRLKWT